MNVRITGGELKGRMIRFQASKALRPTTSMVRGAIFTILGSNLLEGAQVLDLFSGTGAMGIEAISRGAGHVDFIELDSRRCKEIKTILHDFKIDQKAKVTYGNAIDKIDNLDSNYDVLFADPPYGYKEWDRLLAKIEKFQIMKVGSLAIFETSKHENHNFGNSNLIMKTQRKYGDSIISMYMSNG